MAQQRALIVPASGHEHLRQVALDSAYATHGPGADPPFIPFGVCCREGWILYNVYIAPTPVGWRLGRLCRAAGLVGSEDVGGKPPGAGPWGADGERGEGKGGSGLRAASLGPCRVRVSACERVCVRHGARPAFRRARRAAPTGPRAAAQSSALRMTYPSLPYGVSESSE